MSRIGILLFLSVVICIQPFVLAEPPSTVVPQPASIPDPRSAMIPAILFHNQKQNRAIMRSPLLIFARWDIQPPNQILGVEGSFTDEQIIAGLRKFYQEWRPPANDPDSPRPTLIFAQQNWGSGAGLYEPLRAISVEFEIDVYQLYPVVTKIASDPSHPAPQDKRLAELIKGN